MVGLLPNIFVYKKIIFFGEGILLRSGGVTTTKIITWNVRQNLEQKKEYETKLLPPPFYPQIN